MALGLALPVLLAQRHHPASHAGVRGSENSPKGIQAALIAYLLLPRDVIQQQASSGSLPAAVPCLRFLCNTSQKDGVGPLYLWLCNTPSRHTQTYAHIQASLHLHKQACTYLQSRTSSLCLHMFAFAQIITRIHICDHTQFKPDCTVTTKSFIAADWLTFCKGSELTANYSWWPTKAGDGSQCTLCLPTHLHLHGRERWSCSQERTAIL